LRCSHNIWISSSSNAQETENSETCYVLCSIVQIFWNETTLNFIFLIWLKCHDCTFSLLNRIVIKMSCSAKISCELIFNFWTHFSVSQMSHAISENFDVIKYLYEFRSDSHHSTDSSLFFRICFFQLITHSEQSSLEFAWSTDYILFIFHLYVVLVWYCTTSNLKFHLFKSLTHSSIIEEEDQKTCAIVFSVECSMICWS